MSFYEAEKDGLLFSTDKTKLNINYIYAFLTNCYWATGRSLERIIESINHSLCYGIYKQGKQIGFARVVTDYTVCALLCDVFIDENYRGQGIGKTLLDIILNSSITAQVDRWQLATKDAHTLYEKFGFKQNSYLMGHIKLDD
jgi:N-acetylglutamate synthase-like GNAT family acetyltransferase